MQKLPWTEQKRRLFGATTNTLAYVSLVITRGIVAFVLWIAGLFCVLLLGFASGNDAQNVLRGIVYLFTLGLVLWVFVLPLFALRSANKPGSDFADHVAKGTGDASLGDSSRVGQPTQVRRDQMARAIFNRNEPEVQRLLEMGFDVNAPNEFGVTPLKMAQNCDAHQIVALLLKRGARA